MGISLEINYLNIAPTPIYLSVYTGHHLGSSFQFVATLWLNSRETQTLHPKARAAGDQEMVSYQLLPGRPLTQSVQCCNWLSAYTP